MAEIHAIEIAKRPPHTWSQTIHATIFFAVFSLGCLMVNLSQFVALLPLCFLPFSFTNTIYDAGIRLSKGSFGTLLSESFLRFRSHFLTSSGQSSCLNISRPLVSSSLSNSTAPAPFPKMRSTTSLFETGTVGSHLSNFPESVSSLRTTKSVPDPISISRHLLPILGLCRLVVCLVPDLFYGHSQRCLHRFEEKS